MWKGKMDGSHYNALPHSPAQWILPQTADSFGYDGHFAYNYMKTHPTLRTSPAMAAGVTDRPWDVADLVAL
jgi:hypothetical protein